MKSILIATIITAAISIQDTRCTIRKKFNDTYKIKNTTKDTIWLTGISALNDNIYSKCEFDSVFMIMPRSKRMMSFDELSCPFSRNMTLHYRHGTLKDSTELPVSYTARYKIEKIIIR